MFSLLRAFLRFLTHQFGAHDVKHFMRSQPIETTQIYFENDNKRQEETLNLLIPKKIKVARFKPQSDIQELMQRLRSYK